MTLSGSVLLSLCSPIQVNSDISPIALNGAYSQDALQHQLISPSSRKEPPTTLGLEEGDRSPATCLLHLSAEEEKQEFSVE